MLGSHDPRINPRPDDKVTVGGETRVVLDLIGDRVQYSWPDKQAVRTLPLLQWRSWAAGGDMA